MPIPDYQSLMLPVLQCCSGSEVSLTGVTSLVADRLGLSPQDRTALLPSGRQATLLNRISWARTYLDKAGLLERTRRGHFRITPRGQAVLDQHPTAVDNKLLMQFEEFRRFRDRSNALPAAVCGTSSLLPLEEEKQTPDDAMRAAWARIESSLAQDLLERICAAPPAFFERLIVRLLLSMGYGGSVDAGRVLGQSGDGGVDGVIDQDALGLDRVYIQAKRYKEGNKIGSESIRGFFGSLDRHKAAKGLFVTTSTFSLSARETAEHLSRRIVLIDGEQLTRLMIRHNVGCRIEETLFIKKVDEDFFE